MIIQFWTFKTLLSNVLSFEVMSLNVTESLLTEITNFAQTADHGESPNFNLICIVYFSVIQVALNLLRIWINEIRNEVFPRF